MSAESAYSRSAPSHSGSSSGKHSSDGSSEPYRPEFYPADRFRIDKGRVLTPDVIQYFEQMNDELERIDDLDADERAALLNNVWSEVRNREFRLATKKETAPVLERLVSVSSYAQLKTFLRALRKKYYAFAVHHSASHVLQRVLMRAPEVMVREHVDRVVVPWHRDGDNLEDDAEEEEEEEENEEEVEGEDGKKPKSKKKGKKRMWADIPMQDIIAMLCNELSPYWLDIMSTPQGSFVMRTLLLVLAGRTGLHKGDIAAGPDSAPGAGGYNRNAGGYGGPRGGHGGPQGGAGGDAAADQAAFMALVGQSRAHVRHLKDVLPGIVAALAAAPAKAVQDLCYDACAMPVLKTLVHVVAARVRKPSHCVTLEDLVARLLGWKADEGEWAAQRSQKEEAMAIAAVANAAKDGEDDDSEKKDNDDDDVEEAGAAPAGLTEADALASSRSWLLGSGSVKHVSSLFIDPVGSRMLEAILLAAPAPMLHSFLYKHTHGQLLELALDRSGNHAVQRIFAALRDETSFALCYEPLRGELRTLLSAGRAGVVWHAVAAAGRIKCRTGTVAKDILALFGGQRKGGQEGQLVFDVLTLNAQTPEEAAKSSTRRNENDFTRGTYIGAQILSALFAFPPQAAAPFFSSLTSLPAPLLTAVVRDPCGARCVEAYARSAASGKEKSKVARRLCSATATGSGKPGGSLGSLVCVAPAAGFVIEALYPVVDAENRARILRDLADAERKISVSKGGLNLLRKLHVAEYKATGKVWEPAEEKKAAAAAAATAAAAAKAAAAAAIAGGKKGKGKAEAEATAAAAAAAATPSKPKKKAEDILDMFSDILPKGGDDSDDDDVPAAKAATPSKAKKSVKRSHEIDAWADTAPAAEASSDDEAAQAPAAKRSKKAVSEESESESESESSESESSSGEESEDDFETLIKKSTKKQR